MYDTLDIEQVLDEDNCRGELIVRLDVSMEAGSELDLSLDMHGDDGCVLEIEGDDRDFVFLLASDLKQYLKNDVMSLTRWPSRAAAILGDVAGFAPMAAVVLVMFPWMLSAGYDLHELDTVPASTDIAEKLDYLLARQSVPAELIPALSWLMGGMMFAGIASIFLYRYGRRWFPKLIALLFPDYLFQFGREVRRHEKRMRLRQNLLWTVIVGAVISIITAIVVK